MIDVRDVTKVHRRGSLEVHALRGVTCQIPAGSFAFILGPSGSGKSTLLYLLGALDEPSSGVIEVNGRRLGTMTTRERGSVPTRRGRVHLSEFQPVVEPVGR